MTTLSESIEAPRRAQAQRFAALQLLRVDEAKASPADLALVARVRAITEPDRWDAALADRQVQDLLLRRVLYFGENR